ncbi:hypothetical protein H312_02645 [Anncaliia algerae PRA339]|uniref:J domain-containing protein n=1 Tax=Anncaliia algerae PRA339 TaxID=1288291 RepID=A0A059EZ04_9MICR|nr:hypothetical protein H312_02645 [Anncaliia algerae PRA339]
MIEKVLHSSILNIFKKKLYGFKPIMDKSEAKLILNIRKTDLNSVNNAYRKEILLMHPDNGGSKYIASKIHEAKDILLNNK